VSIGILYALASLCFAGVNDFAFKQYIQHGRRPLGLFVMGVGVIWTAVFGAGVPASSASSSPHCSESSSTASPSACAKPSPSPPPSPVS